MNKEKSTLRARAGLLFAAEERSQELMGMALWQQPSQVKTLEETAVNHLVNNRQLEDLALDSDQAILNVN